MHVHHQTNIHEQIYIKYASICTDKDGQFTGPSAIGGINILIISLKF